MMDVKPPHHQWPPSHSQNKKPTFPKTKIIVITGYDDVEQVFHALRAGASAYCAKDTTPEALISTIHKRSQ